LFGLYERIATIARMAIIEATTISSSIEKPEEEENLTFDFITLYRYLSQPLRLIL
jgi:hypothetical protein